MNDRKTGSFKPLTISAENLPASTARQDELTSYAAERAALLFGCYRTGEANDPGTFVAAITAILARYPEEVITAVTHPANLPSKKDWLPTVREVVEACDEVMEPIIQQQARTKRIKEQMEARWRIDNGIKPTMRQLKERFGENWGISPPTPVLSAEQKAAENAKALDRESARVRAEYERAGINPPASKWALSLAARRLMEEQDEVRQAAE